MRSPEEETRFWADWPKLEIRSAGKMRPLDRFRRPQKRESGGVRVQGSAGGIGQQRRTQAAPLESLVHGQSPDPNGGHGRITRQALSFVRGQISKWDTGGADRVISCNVARGSFDGYEAISDTAANVLGNLGLKITIKDVFAAAK